MYVCFGRSLKAERPSDNSITLLNLWLQWQLQTCIWQETTSLVKSSRFIDSHSRLIEYHGRAWVAVYCKEQWIFFVLNVVDLDLSIHTLPLPLLIGFLFSNIVHNDMSFRIFTFRISHNKFQMNRISEFLEPLVIYRSFIPKKTLSVKK